MQHLNAADHCKALIQSERHRRRAYAQDLITRFEQSEWQSTLFAEAQKSASEAGPTLRVIALLETYLT